MQNDVQLFVRDAYKNGASADEIRGALKSAGWQQDEIENALGMYAGVAFGSPVPKRKPYLSAREAFMYLLLFLTLYLSSISFGTLIFQYVNIWLPDALQPSYLMNDTMDAIRMSTSMLIVSFPVFMFMSWLMAKGIEKDPDKRSSRIRKWLTYITLFIAAGVIIGDLVTLVYNLLRGELTLRFDLKILTILVIAGTIFGYYLWDLRKEEQKS